MLTLLGTVTLLVFVFLIFTKRLHVITGLVLVPIIAGLVGGYSKELGKLMLDGIKTVAPTGVMIMFSVMFFSILLDTGLFNPLITRILSVAKNDPVKITVGTALLTLLVALDGDGTTTFMIVTLAMLPIYTKVGMNPLVLTCITSLAFYLMNSSPWGGPTMRAMAILDRSVTEIFVPMIPALLICGLWILFVAYVLGRKERKRLGYVNVQNEIAPTVTVDVIKTMGQDSSLLRPNLKWINLLLLIVAMVALVKGWLPPAPLFIAAFAIAIWINYREFDLMEERIRAHAGNALWTATMVFGAGIFTGVLQGTKMIDAIAYSLVSLIPEALGPHMPIISGIFSYLSTLVVSPDAFYFGMLPIISKTATFYGIDPAVTGRAALFGQIGYGISPLVAAPLLLCSMAKVQFFDHQRFTFIWGFLTTIVTLVAAVLTGCIPL